MDTEAFLLERQSLEAEMEATRALALAYKPEPNFLWLGFPLLPLAGFFAAKQIDGKKHPMVRGLVKTGIRQMLMKGLKSWGLKQLLQPSTIQRVVSFIR